MMLTWVYQPPSSRTSRDTRGSARICSSRLRPSSMFTSTRPSSQRYQVAVDTGWPSRRSVAMTAGLGLRSMTTAASGSGGFDMGPPSWVVFTVRWHRAPHDAAPCPRSSPRRNTRSGGLPELDSVALGIGDPAEPADALHGLGLADHIRSLGAQLRQHRFQVADPEVKHGLLSAGPEIIGPGIERREHRRPVSLTPQAVLIGVQAQAVAIPSAQGGRVGGPDEVPADSKHTFHAAILPAGRSADWIRDGSASVLKPRFRGGCGHGR